jgi:ADP-ribosylglycohydrolase
MGALIGDALAMGVHWYYDVDELIEVRGGGTFVRDYLDPLEGKYHYGKLHQGQRTQTGYLTELLLQSVASQGRYDSIDFCARWDQLLSRLDGTRTGGDHGWTSKDMCDVYKNRIAKGLTWEDGQGGFPSASPKGDTTDSMIRSAVLAALLHGDMKSMCEAVAHNAKLHYADSSVISHSVCFSAVLAAAIRGAKVDTDIGDHLYKLAQEGDLPFTFQSGGRDDEDGLAEPDGLLWPSAIISSTKALEKKGLGGVPPHLVASMYGIACGWFMQLPSAYYIAGRFEGDFEGGLVSAVNAGGNNCSRAALVGALLGAQVGLKGIPARWIEQLDGSAQLVAQTRAVARLGLATAEQEKVHQNPNLRGHATACRL